MKIIETENGEYWTESGDYFCPSVLRATSYNTLPYRLELDDGWAVARGNDRECEYVLNGQVIATVRELTETEVDQKLAYYNGCIAAKWETTDRSTDDDFQSVEYDLKSNYIGTCSDSYNQGVTDVIDTARRQQKWDKAMSKWFSPSNQHAQPTIEE